MWFISTLAPVTPTNLKPVLLKYGPYSNLTLARDTAKRLASVASLAWYKYKYGRDWGAVAGDKFVHAMDYYIYNYNNNGSVYNYYDGGGATLKIHLDGDDKIVVPPVVTEQECNVRTPDRPVLTPPIGSPQSPISSAAETAVIKKRISDNLITNFGNRGY